MKRAGVTVLFGALVVLALAGGPGAAQEFQGDPSSVVAIISGEDLGGGRLLLSLSGGPALDTTLRLYSEPSHTPLAFAATVGFAESEEGRAWQAGWSEEPTMFVSVDELAAVGFKRAFDRPADDTRIQLWLGRVGPDGEVTETVVSDADVGSEDFLFFSALGEAQGPNTHCCGMEDGSEACVICPGAAFGCSPIPSCGH